jgi:hypothetical protein
MLWKLTDAGRRGICRLPFRLRKATTDLIAGGIYWPLARLAAVAEKAGANVANLPLSAYRRLRFYTMRTDALDRFGTRLEQRFTRGEIERLMADAGLTDIRFSDDVPFWTVCGCRAEAAR